MRISLVLCNCKQKQICYRTSPIFDSNNHNYCCHYCYCQFTPFICSDLPRHTWSPMNRVSGQVKAHVELTAQMGSRPITFLWLWPATDHEPHCRHVPINKIWRRTESTPRSGWWRSHMAGIYSDCSTSEIIIIRPHRMHRVKKCSLLLPMCLLLPRLRLPLPLAPLLYYYYHRHICYYYHYYWGSEADRSTEGARLSRTRHCSTWKVRCRTEYYIAVTVAIDNTVLSKIRNSDLTHAYYY